MRLLLYIVLLAYGIGFAFSPTLFSGFHRLQTDPGDTILNHYFLEHSWRLVSQADYLGTLWSPAFFYPAPNVLGYSDNLFGAAPIYWLLRCFANDVLAYQIWMILGFALNFIAMAVVLRWFGLSHSMCALGAFLFAFGTPHVQQIGHQQLSYRCWTPFALCYAWRFVTGPRASILYRCLLCVIWQFYAVVYVGWFLSIGIGIMGLVLVVRDCETRQRLWGFARTRPFALAWPFAVNGLALAVLVVPYLQANRGFQRNIDEVMGGLPRWNCWLSAPPGTLWEPVLRPIGIDVFGESFLFGGLVFLILGACCVLVSFRRDAGANSQLIRTWSVTILLLFVLTISIWTPSNLGFSLWSGVYYVVPGAKAIRCVMRIYLIFYPMLTIAGLLALQTLLRASAIKRTRPLIMMLILLAAVENYYPQIDVPARSFAHARFYSHARQLSEQMREADAAYAIVNADRPGYEQELQMMWAGLYANTPVANGYSGRWPNNYPLPAGENSLDELKTWLGPTWRGRLLVITRMEPIQREVWVGESGEWKRIE